MNLKGALEGQSLHAPIPLGSLPPAKKLGAAAVFAVGTSLIEHLEPAAVACLIPVVLAIVGKLPSKKLFRRLLPVNIFFLFLWITLPLQFADGSLRFRSDGLWLAALITLKGNAIAGSLIILAGTSGISSSCRALLELRIPEKLVTLLVLTYGNLSFMTEEAKRLFAAARLRGFNPSATSIASYKTFGYLFAMLLLRSWQKSQRVNNAMRLRGFSGRFPLIEPFPVPLKYTSTGKSLLYAICLVTGILLVLDRLLF